MSTKTVHVVKANGIPACEMFPTVGMQDTYDTEEEALSMIPWWRSRSQGISPLTMTWRVDENKVEYDDTPRWVIHSSCPYSGDSVYWSNDDGWVSLEAADKFTDYETSTLRLPLGGKWTTLNNAKYWYERNAQ